MTHIYTSIKALEARELVGSGLNEGAYRDLDSREGSLVQRRMKLAFVPRSYICTGESRDSSKNIAGKLAESGALVAAELGHKSVRYYNPRHSAREDLFTQKPKQIFRAAKQ